MRGGVEQKKEQKKEGLLEAAYQLFLEKGVNKTSKGHLLQANWALIVSHLMAFRKSTYEKLGQKET